MAPIGGPSVDESSLSPRYSSSNMWLYFIAVAGTINKEKINLVEILTEQFGSIKYTSVEKLKIFCKVHNTVHKTSKTQYSYENKILH